MLTWRPTRRRGMGGLSSCVVLRLLQRRRRAQLAAGEWRPWRGAWVRGKVLAPRGVEAFISLSPLLFRVVVMMESLIRASLACFGLQPSRPFVCEVQSWGEVVFLCVRRRGRGVIYGGSRLRRWECMRGVDSDGLGGALRGSTGGCFSFSLPFREGRAVGVRGVAAGERHPRCGRGEGLIRSVTAAWAPGAGLCWPGPGVTSCAHPLARAVVTRLPGYQRPRIPRPPGFLRLDLIQSVLGYQI
jgi:hypothetical protein